MSDWTQPSESLEDEVPAAASIPEFMRKAMEAAGVDVDAVAAKAAEIEEQGGVDALALNDYGKIVERRRVDEPIRDETPLFDPDANTLGAFHAPETDAPDTERLAAIDVYPRTGTQRRAVLDYLARCGGGATDEEIRNATGVRRARTRRHELLEGGWVCDSGIQRKVGTGNLAEVWTLTQAGRDQWVPPPSTYERED